MLTRVHFSVFGPVRCPGVGKGWICRVRYVGSDCKLPLLVPLNPLCNRQTYGIFPFRLAFSPLGGDALSGSRIFVCHVRCTLETEPTKSDSDGKPCPVSVRNKAHFLAQEASHQTEARKIRLQRFTCGCHRIKGGDREGTITPTSRPDQRNGGFVSYSSCLPPSPSLTAIIPVTL